MIFSRTRSAGSPDIDAKYKLELNTACLNARRAAQACWPGTFSSVNVITGLQYAEAAVNYGIPAVLSACMEEVTHKRFQGRVRKTSGRHIVAELLQYENFREAAQYLHHVCQHPAIAMCDPHVQRLPIEIRSVLCDHREPSAPDAFDGATLRALLLPRPVSSSGFYGEAVLDCEKQQIDRIGPSSRASLALSELEQAVLAFLLGHPKTFTSHPLIYPVSFLSMEGLPFRHATVWAAANKGICYYAVDGPRHSASHSGIVRVQSLFVFEDQFFAQVCWGEAKEIDRATECRRYAFSTLEPTAVTRCFKRLCKLFPSKNPQRHGKLGWSGTNKPDVIIRAQRLVEYVHFGLCDGNLVLNDFFISW